MSKNYEIIYTFKLPKLIKIKLRLAKVVSSIVEKHEEKLEKLVRGNWWKFERNKTN